MASGDISCSKRLGALGIDHSASATSSVAHAPTKRRVLRLLTKRMRIRIVISMATKNVYVSDDDADLFSEAAELGGGLSPAVSSGLRLFVEAKRRESAGVAKVELDVDEGGVTVTKRFLGRRLVKHRQQSERHLVITEVFETVRRQFAVYVRTVPTWTFNGLRADGTGWGPEDYEAVVRSLEIFPSKEELERALPSEQWRAFERAAEGKLIEDLDV